MRLAFGVVGVTVDVGVKLGLDVETLATARLVVIVPSCLGIVCRMVDISVETKLDLRPGIGLQVVKVRMVLNIVLVSNGPVLSGVVIF